MTCLLFFFNQKGFPERIQNDVFSNIAENNELEFKVDSLRQYSAWIGGSMLGSLSTFQKLAINRSEYEENLDKIIFKKTL